eukprot:7571625-Alexandrium_andersonii.AAC.1
MAARQLEGDPEHLVAAKRGAGAVDGLRHLRPSALPPDRRPSAVMQRGAEHGFMTAPAAGIPAYRERPACYSCSCMVSHAH